MTEDQLLKLISNVRLRPDEAEKLKEVAWNLSMKKKDFIKEPDIIHFLIKEFLQDVDLIDGQLVRKNKVT